MRRCSYKLLKSLNKKIDHSVRFRQSRRGHVCSWVYTSMKFQRLGLHTAWSSISIKMQLSFLCSIKPWALKTCLSYLPHTLLSSFDSHFQGNKLHGVTVTWAFGTKRMSLEPKDKLSRLMVLIFCNFPIMISMAKFNLNVLSIDVWTYFPVDK